MPFFKSAEQTRTHSHPNTYSNNRKNLVPSVQYPARLLDMANNINNKLKLTTWFVEAWWRLFAHISFAWIFFRYSKKNRGGCVYNGVVVMMMALHISIHIVCLFLCILCSLRYNAKCIPCFMYEYTSIYTRPYQINFSSFSYYFSVEKEFFRRYLRLPQ